MKPAIFPYLKNWSACNALVNTEKTLASESILLKESQALNRSWVMVEISKVPHGIFFPRADFTLTGVLITNRAGTVKSSTAVKTLQAMLSDTGKLVKNTWSAEIHSWDSRMKSIPEYLRTLISRQSHTLECKTHDPEL